MLDIDRRPASDGRSPVSFPAFFIVGPTGVGKTDIAIKVARRCNAEIVGADAFQIYRGLEILTAKPSAEARRLVPHYMIDHVSIEQNYDVAEYLAAAKQAIADIHSRGRLPLIVGGTGLYVRALTHGLADLPSADSELRAALDRQTLAELQEQLQMLDPKGAEQIDLQNRRRVSRAIEIRILTGQSLLQQRKEWSEPVNYSGVLLIRQRDELYARINRRVEEMFAAGLLEEVSQLPKGGSTARQAIGFAEAQACLRGEISQRQAIQKIQQATRRYAKRQLTWFRRDPTLEAVDLTALSDFDSLIAKLADLASVTRTNTRSSSNV